MLVALTAGAGAGWAHETGEAQAPRAGEIQAPRADEVPQAVRGEDAQAPRGQDVQAPRSDAIPQAPLVRADQVAPALAGPVRLAEAGKVASQRTNRAGARLARERHDRLAVAPAILVPR